MWRTKRLKNKERRKEGKLFFVRKCKGICARRLRCWQLDSPAMRCGVACSMGAGAGAGAGAGGCQDGVGAGVV